MKKIGNRPITEADTDLSIWMNFVILSAHFGTVTQCLVKLTMPKCALKIPKFIQIKKSITDEKFI